MYAETPWRRGLITKVRDTAAGSLIYIHTLIDP